MRLHTIGVIFRKELLDTLRDRKTLIFMVALPVLLVPGISTIMTRVMRSEAKKTQQRTLVVQAEPDERDRLLAFLRARTKPMAAQTEKMIQLLGPSVREPLKEIAASLGTNSFDALLRVRGDDATVRNHPRFAELRSAFASQSTDVDTLKRNAKEAGVDLDDPNSPGVQEAKRFHDLVLPLVTLDFVSAAEVASRPATQAAPPLESLPDKVRGDPSSSAAAIAIAERRIQARVRVPRSLDETLVSGDATASVAVLYDSTIDLSAEAQRRIAAALDAASRLATDERLARDSLPKSFVTPVTVDATNAAPAQKEVRKAIASLLPYILILMCFLGAFHPATELGAGEKERLTLETLLVAPASRLEIAIGKFGVVFVSSLVASLLATGSMTWTLTSGAMVPELRNAIDLELDVKTVVVCLALIAPLAATFASLLLALSIYAKTQKEAQSMMMPLQFLIIVPAMISMVPTIELDTKFAWVPVLNVALGLRALLTAGGAPLPWLAIGIIFVSTTIVAGAGLAFCSRRFQQERVIFRS